MVLKKDDKKEKANKTIMYMLETINVLVENQKILLKRIHQIEEHMEMIAGKILDNIEDDDNDRIIN